VRLSESLQAAFGYGWSEVPTFEKDVEFDPRSVVRIDIDIEDFGWMDEDGWQTDNKLFLIGSDRVIAKIGHSSINALKWFQHYMEMVKDNE
jgi:hypothetical protein